MDFGQLRNFVCIAQLGGFSKAEQALDISQPSLSRQMRLLEDDLNTKLFLRTGRGVTLTPAGEAFLPHAQAVLDSVEKGRQAMRSASTDLTGRIIVGMVPRVARVLTAPLVLRFRQRYPNATLSVIEGKTPVLLTALGVGHVDVAILFNLEAPDDLVTEPISEEGHALIGLRREGQTTPSSIPFKALADYPLILPPPANSVRAHLELARRRHQTEFQVVVEVETLAAVFDLVKLGVGWSVVGEGEARLLRDNPLFVSARIEGMGSRIVSYLTRSRRFTPTYLGNAVSDLIRELDVPALLGANPVQAADRSAQT